MREIIVNIDKKKAEYLERVNYELSFTKDIIQRIIESHPNDPEIINGTAFRHYQKQGAELQAEYNIAASEIENLYIPKELIGHRYSWNIPVDSDELIVSILCDCEIEGLDGVINR